MRALPDDDPRWVIHLPVTAPDLARARMLARTVTRSLAFLAALDPGETTVSEEDDQHVRHRIFCDRLLDGGRRCVLRAEHETACAARIQACATRIQRWNAPGHYRQL